MKREGQVAVFIIVAIFIVGAIVLVSMLPKSVEKPPESSTDQVYSYVHILIENGAFKCLQQVGSQGGYYKIPNRVSMNETAYWYYEGVNVQPFLSLLETETATCVDEVLKSTVDDVLRAFGNQSVDVDSSAISSVVSVGEWRTTIEVNYPIVVSNEGSTAVVSDFSVNYEMNLLRLYELATGIVNYAGLPEFDKCDPSKNCYDENINFSFFNEGEDLFIKGQTFAIFSNQTREEPYELKFAIKRPIKEAFRESGKKLAVLYQDEEGLETFGGKSIEVLNKLDLLSGVDYYGCDGISSFISKIDDYDVVMITGNLQFQIVRHSIWNKLTEGFEDAYSDGGLSGDSGELLFGCNEFNDLGRKSKLKNWVNSGGVLWINNVKKYETDNFVVSYIGHLGYSGGQWKPVNINDIEGSLVKSLEEERGTVTYLDIRDKGHYLLTCPNDLSEDIVGTWRSYPLKIGSSDEIVLGSQSEAILWIRKLGNGFIVFDQFLLKDNVYEKLGYDDDLYSKGLAEKYFVNVLNYLAKSMEYKKAELEISLISPLNDEEVNEPIFSFESKLGKDASYGLVITDVSGVTKSLILDEGAMEEFSSNNFKVDLTNDSMWTELNEERYEWQIRADKYFSNIGTFTKRSPAQINETIGGNETDGNQTV